MASLPELVEMQLDTLRPNGQVGDQEHAFLDPDTTAPLYIEMDDSDEADETFDAIDVAASMARAEADAESLASVGEVIAAPFFEDTAKYTKYVIQAVDALELPNIGGDEFVAVHVRVVKGVHNQLPKPWGLVRLLALLVYDQKVRDIAGAPLRFNSLHRTRDYNKAIKGASSSPHPACTARDRSLRGEGTDAARVKKLAEIDIALRGKRVKLTEAQQATINKVREDYALVSPPFGESVFGEPFRASGVAWQGDSYIHTGGIGRYPTFVHADCRGIATDWVKK